MRISIITVNYNNKEGLKSTIESVKKQTCQDFEYIIVDGNSNDGSKDIIEQYKDSINKWVSEPDSGIYNAMNKAVRMASGDYCLFMNSGDILYSPKTIEEILSHELRADFIEGIISLRELRGKLHYPTKTRNFSDYILGTNNFHQASLIKRNLLLRIPYDESYIIAADLKFNIESIIVNNCSYTSLDVIIADYEGAGRSRTIQHEEERKRLYSELIPQKILNDYEDIRFIKEWPGYSLWPVFKCLSKSKYMKKLKSIAKSIIYRK